MSDPVTPNPDRSTDLTFSRKIGEVVVIADTACILLAIEEHSVVLGFQNVHDWEAGGSIIPAAEQGVKTDFGVALQVPGVDAYLTATSSRDDETVVFSGNVPADVVLTRYEFFCARRDAEGKEEEPCEFDFDPNDKDIAELRKLGLL